ncbi:DUF1365 domain-containing protein [Alteromonas sp. KUL156]|uniref:DUF1365 domain-containing protein n=1 Tax=Alteromonas sp. KUL106 TaxID=2480799 RepID=UPI0012E59EF9|nr:DUF1365 domain-containing protein [Alteromonas sp. KUL106]GFD70170.1 DUF1365 domain-containing protein [Alteromonas sp. KUL106]GFD81691.1 DUF1365 domain-containing protein [Tenacibaculum sp. KUL118]GFD97099.1 DUF1365 domain-containing protein [Alteromonas sp. KUL154]GFE00628.1 DUF1365 domain-containing protein [Alteromonas sp. KUL156]
MTESALYKGKVYHQRFKPTQHKFDYDIYLFWLKLETEELATLSRELQYFSAEGKARVRFKREDYLGDPSVSLREAVLDRMTELNEGSRLSGDVFMLGQLRMWGWYFSPVNFYYLRNSEGKYTHMLAEVSNTPWNERHHYLVNLDTQDDTPKAFHVSPFNPMDMTYQWSISQPSTNLSLAMDCVRNDKEFSAGINLTKFTLDNANLTQALKRIPSMTIKTVAGIYWHALKLLLKRTPLYTHPEKSQEQ